MIRCIYGLWVFVNYYCMVTAAAGGTNVQWNIIYRSREQYNKIILFIECVRNDLFTYIMCTLY